MKIKKIKSPKQNDKCVRCGHPYNEHDDEDTDVRSSGGQCLHIWDVDEVTKHKEDQCECPEFLYLKTDHFKKTRKKIENGALALALRNVEYWKDKAMEAAQTDGKNTNVFIGRFADKQRGLPRGTRVSFKMGGKKGHENIVDVYLEDGILWVHHATGLGDLYIRSHSSNLIQCHILKGKI